MKIPVPQVGDLVQEWLTEQLGIVVKVSDRKRYRAVQVLWTTQGHSMWNGYKEWKDIRSLEIVSESR